MFTILSQLVGSISQQRTRYIALVALAALVVSAALLGIDSCNE
jgi:hypothetical protein